MGAFGSAKQLEKVEIVELEVRTFDWRINFVHRYKKIM